MLIIRSQITIKVLDYFFVNPGKSCYINELAKMLKIDPGNLYRKLRELESDGLLISDTRGNQKYYGLNKRYPLLKEYKKAYGARYGLNNKLKNTLRNIPGLEEAFLFGSFARGQAEEGSDIDLLLIGSHSSLEATRKIGPIGKLLGREINMIDMTRSEYDKRRKKDDFLKQVLTAKPVKLI